MIDKLVSVVVPVFNSQNYIKQCIESILNQTYRKIQVIIVDDGSVDDSLQICKEMQEYDDRITILKQSNSGTAVARKNGICAALGEYVTFVDSDDFIDNDYIEKLILHSEKCDLVTSRLLFDREVLRDGIPAGNYAVDMHSPVIKNMIYLSDNVTRGILTNMCGKLFRTYIAREIVKEIDLNIFFGEDGEFVYKYILRCNRVCVTDYCGYNYRVNNQSITHICHEDFLINTNRLFCSLKRTFEDSIYANELIPQLERWCALHIRITGRKMNFQNKNLFLRYIIPCKKMIANKNIVVYGAGRVGLDYIRQIKKEDICNEVIWVDKNYKNKDDFLEIKVDSPDEVMKNDFDYVLVAVNKEEVAYEIQEELLQMKVPLDKIVFQKPINIEEFYA